MAEPYERLQEARRAAGYETATDAARAFGWNENTYRSHENGERGLKRDVAERYARAFHVSPGWLLTGEGTAPGSGWYSVRVVGRIGAGAEIEPDFEELGEESLFEIEVPFPVPPDAIAFEVEGTSMWPRYDPGDVVVCKREHTRPENLADPYSEVALKTADGRRFLKRIRPGSNRSTWDLEAFNAPPIRDVRLDWIGEVVLTVRRGQWRQANSRQLKALARKVAKAVAK